MHHLSFSWCCLWRRRRLSVVFIGIGRNAGGGSGGLELVEPRLNARTHFSRGSCPLSQADGALPLTRTAPRPQPVRAVRLRGLRTIAYETTSHRTKGYSRRAGGGQDPSAPVGPSQSSSHHHACSWS